MKLTTVCWMCKMGDDVSYGSDGSIYEWTLWSLI